MHFRERLWNYSLVTVVAILIWVWAAQSTKNSGSAGFRLHFAPAAAGEQIVSPSELTVDIQMEGSNAALQNARELAFSGPLTLTVGQELPSVEAEHVINLVDVLERNDRLVRTGVTVASVDPVSTALTIDALVPVTADIVAVLPGVDPEGSVEVDPPQAVVKLPARLRDLMGDRLAIEAHVPQTRLQRLEPGVLNTIDKAKLRLPAQFAGQKGVTITPPTASVKFTIRSTIRETTLPTVRVQVAGPPEDHEEYVINIEDNTLTDVTVKADADLIREIIRGDAVVVALVHLSHLEKEHGVESKAVTCFMALPKDAASNTVRPTIVEAEVNGSSQLPVVRLSITERTAG